MAGVMRRGSLRWRILHASPPTASPTAAASRRSAAAALLGASLVHLQISPSDVFSIETCNRFCGLCVIGHFHEREAAGPACFPVHRDVYTRHLSKGLEELAQLAFGCLKTHIANKEILHVISLVLYTAARFSPSWLAAQPLRAFSQRAF